MKQCATNLVLDYSSNHDGNTLPALLNTSHSFLQMHTSVDLVDTDSTSYSPS